MEWLEKKNRKLQIERARKLDEEMAQTYKHTPHINSNSKKLASSTGGSFLERQKLFSERKQKKKARVEKEMYHKFTHSPKLNFKSLDIVNKSIRR